MNIYEDEPDFLEDSYWGESEEDFYVRIQTEKDSESDY